MSLKFRIFEICLYALVNFLPCFFLALYPFAGKFRFSRKVTYTLLIPMLALESAVCIWASLFTANNGLVSLLKTVGFAAFFFLAVKEYPGKQLFVLLMLPNLSNQIAFTAKCLEGFLFPAFAAYENHWSFSVSILIVQLVFIPLFFLFEKKAFKDAIAVQSQEQLWRYLWLIPAIFYLFWLYLAYLIPTPGIQMALDPKYTILVTLFNCGAVLIYYVVAQTVENSSQNVELRIQNALLTIQNLQYENLEFRMDEARHARHDLRQHMTVLHTFCENKEYDKLSQYLQDYLKSLPPDLPIRYCEHFALNALLVYYAQVARNRHIDFSAQIHLPQNIPIDKTDLTVLFGNLLENACEGCMTLPEDKRQIQLQGKMLDQGSFVFTIENTFSEPVRMVRGQYLSSKHTGTGIGIKSVQNIVNKYNGVVQIETKEDLFCVSVVLNLL